jgi:hypothetical protein
VLKHKRLDSINLKFEKELAQRDNLYQKRMKLHGRGRVRQFQNNDGEYAKIKNLEEKCIVVYQIEKCF